MITIYGSPKSSAGRCFWCLEEVEATYQNKAIDFRAQEHKSADFLKINPNGKVPALTDGEFTIWESMAINFYLADAYRPSLLGKEVHDRGLVQQWSIWSLAELQVPLIDIFIQLVFVPEDKRDLKVIEKSKGKMPSLLNTLDAELENRKFLVADDFTLADLNVASVVSICHHINYELSDYENITSWLARMSERPAFQKYQELMK